MDQEISARMDGSGRRFAIVVSRFNDAITRRLLDGAVDALTRHGVAARDITRVWVPGAFELPLVARTLAASGACDAVLCLGCLVRGQTPHFDYICSACASGISAAALETGVPIAFGVITADSAEQASDRAGGKGGNKGVEAALAAIEMVGVLAAIRGIEPTEKS